MPNHLDNIELRSESVQEVLSNPPSWIIRWGITVIFFVLLSVLAVSWFVKYPEFIDAQVVVTTLTPPEKIEARTGGKIEKLFIEDHSFVNSKQKLAVLESSGNYNDILELRAVMDSFKPNYEDFSFPFNTFSRSSLGEVEVDFIQFEKAFTDYKLQKQLQPYAPETLAGEQSLNQIGNRIKVLQSQKSLELKKLSLEKTNLDRAETLYSEGVIAKAELETTRIQYLQAQQAVKNIDINISQLRESKSTAQKGITSTNITKQQTETEQLKSVLQSYDQLKKSMRDWERQYLFTSSIDGMISFQTYWGENQFVKAGDVVFSILPQNKDNLIGKLVVPAQNSGKIKTNQKVIIKLDNYPYQEFGTVQGIVKNVSISSDKDGNYFVEVELPNHLKTTHNKTLVFDKELRGTAQIVTEDLRLIERFFYQFREVFQYN